MRSCKTWWRSSRLQARHSSSSALVSSYTGTIATVFAPNFEFEEKRDRAEICAFPFSLFSHSTINLFLVASSECTSTLVIVSLLTPNIESLLHTHVTFFCIVCLHFRLFSTVSVGLVHGALNRFSLSLSRMLVVHLHTQFDWLIYAFSRTPHENSKTY